MPQLYPACLYRGIETPLLHEPALCCQNEKKTACLNIHKTGLKWNRPFPGIPFPFNIPGKLPPAPEWSPLLFFRSYTMRILLPAWTQPSRSNNWNVIFYPWTWFQRRFFIFSTEVPCIIRFFWPTSSCSSAQFPRIGNINGRRSFWKLMEIFTSSGMDSYASRTWWNSRSKAGRWMLAQYTSGVWIDREDTRSKSL